MKKGFTLVEILIVIAIIGILLTVTLAAINPARQFSQANNTKRRVDIKTILDGVTQYSSDNTGTLPGGDTIPTSPAAALEIKKTAGVDLCADLTPTYIASLPNDPDSTAIPVTTCTEDYNTKYKIVKNTDNRITISAPLAELGETISVTR